MTSQTRQYAPTRSTDYWLVPTNHPRLKNPSSVQGTQYPSMLHENARSLQLHIPRRPLQGVAMVAQADPQHHDTI